MTEGEKKNPMQSNNRSRIKIQLQKEAEQIWSSPKLMSNAPNKTRMLSAQLLHYFSLCTIYIYIYKKIKYKKLPWNNVKCVTRARGRKMVEARKVKTVTRFGGWFPGMLTQTLVEQSTLSHLYIKHTLKVWVGFKLVLKSFTEQSCYAELNSQPLTPAMGSGQVWKQDQLPGLGPKRGRWEKGKLDKSAN